LRIVWGDTQLRALLEVLVIILNGLLRVFMVRMIITKEKGYGMNWLGILAGGRCHGVLGVILMLSNIRVRDIATFDSQHLRWIFLISFFTTVVETRYDSMMGSWCSKEVVGPLEWEWGVFSRFVRYEVGNRSKIMFCHDLWCVEQPLKVTFMELFSILRCLEAWVADHVLL
jgi:hypothetical protein